MTLLDILKLMRHYIKMVAAIVVACALAGAGLGIIKLGLDNAEYTAEAVLTMSEPTATVSAGELMPLAQAIAANIVSEKSEEGVSISQAADLATRTISFTAEAGTEVESIEAVNDAAAQTAEEVSAVLQNMADQYRAELAAEQTKNTGDPDGSVTFGLSERNRAAALEMVSFTVNDASRAANSSRNGITAKYGLAGFLSGLFLSIFIVVIIDLIKAPLKGREDVEKCFDVSVLAEGNALNLGDRLWANVQFAMGKVPHSICLVPVADQLSRGIEESLGNAIVSKGVEDVSVVACLPLGKGMDAAYAARDADITVVCAVPWRDSLRQVADTLRELELAQAKVAGVVLVSMER